MSVTLRTSLQEGCTILYCKREAGFALVELMIVTAIIGILATIAAPRLLAYRNKLRVASTVASSEGVRAALATYAVDSVGNVYPDEDAIESYADLIAIINANGGSLPTNPPFDFLSYNAPQPIADDYSIRFAVKGVNPPTPGTQVLVTPGGIYRCSGPMVASCQ